MTSTILSCLATVLACATALLVGYLHRKQIRQVEAFRQDPRVGLRPPDSAVAVFIKGHWHFLFVAWPVFSLYRAVRAPGPPTRFDVFAIALNVAAIAVMIAVAFTARLVVLAVTTLREQFASRIDRLAQGTPIPAPPAVAKRTEADRPTAEKDPGA